MAIFLLVFLSIYGALNAYLLWKIHRAFPDMGWWLLAPTGFILLMMLGPLLVHALVRWGLPLLARALALLVYPWMAIIFWFVVLGLLLEAWTLAMRLAEFGAPGAGRLIPGPRAQLWGLCAAVFLLGCWGLCEARSVRLERVVLRTDRLPAGSPPVRIALLADLHMSGLVSPGRLERALRLVDEARPDLVISAGDFIDSPLLPEDRLAARLATVRPPLGKFAVFGNHEVYAGQENADRFLHAAGFRVLHGEALDAGPLRLVGIDDPGHGAPGRTARPDESTVLSADPARPFTILIKHRPQVSPAALGRFDLQLSGHTHGGQVFPFGLVVRTMFRQTSGLHQLGPGSYLYVSRGTGTWGPPMRLLARPEVVLISVEPQGPPAGGGPAGHVR